MLYCCGGLILPYWKYLKNIFRFSFVSVVQKLAEKSTLHWHEKQNCAERICFFFYLHFFCFIIFFYNKPRSAGGQVLDYETWNRETEKGPHIQRHFSTAYSPKMNSCLVVWSCRTMRRIWGKWALGWHCTHALWRGRISTLERI